MTLAVLHKLLALFLTVGLGWVAGRAGWLGGRSDAQGALAGRTVADLAFVLFVPALLFRTMVLQDLSALPWRTLGAFFVPAVLCVLAVYAGYRRAGRGAGAAQAPAEAPATRTVAVCYGNGVQLGIPVSAALYGDAGLALHVTLMSLHGLILMTLMTVLAELDRARRDTRATLVSAVATAVRQALLHPVVLPLVAGAAWNLTGLGLHPALDEVLAGLGRAVVPTCLLLIGLNLAQYGLKGGLRGAVLTSVLKLLLMPALVLAVAYLGFGLRGMPLGVVVMMAALPTGSNALLFAHRYGLLQAEATAAIVASTVAFVVTASVWLAVLALLPA